MIASLRGTLLEATPVLAVIEVAGVGYEVHVPVTTAERLPAPGQEARLFIHAVYREDNQQLYGFAAREDREVFRLLIEKVSGVGPKVALAVLSSLSRVVLENAIRNQDIALLSKCPGIGRKTAERIVIELRDAFGSLPASPAVALPPGRGAAAASSGAAQAIADAVQALLALGYRPPEADKAIRQAAQALGESATTETLLRTALAGGKAKP